MFGRRKKPKSDDAQSKSTSRQSTYRDWDTIVPGEPMASQPYAQPSYPAQPPPAPAQPAYTPQPQAPATPPQAAYQQPAPAPQYQQQVAPQYQQPAAPQQAAVSATPVPAASVNPTDGTCTKCGGAFGQKAICESCGTGRTACLVCGTKIWAGALTCSAHSNAVRR